MMSNAVQLTLSLGFSAPPWVVMVLVGVFAGTGAAMTCRIVHPPKRRLTDQSIPEEVNRPVRARLKR